MLFSIIKKKKILSIFNFDFLKIPNSFNPQQETSIKFDDISSYTKKKKTQNCKINNVLLK
jgi:hypothetical protein